MPKKIKGIVILFVSAALIACDSKAVFDSYVSYPNEWHKDSIASFKFMAPDTLKNYNLFINIRNNNDYKFNNLFLITELSYPHGKTVKDTLEYKMAKPNGELLGTGFTDVKENKLWLKGYERTFKFEEEGEHQINIQHAMRQNGQVNGLTNLEGITEVGFRLESVQ
jgi:gliding motility-associated lipoprotein GldH